MFDSIKNSVPPRGSEKLPEDTAPIVPKPSQGRVEDIFSEADKTAAPTPAFSRPLGGEPEKPAVFQPKTSPLALGKETGADSGDNLNKMLILGSGALGLIIILGGAWLGYSKFFKGGGSNNLPDSTAEEQDKKEEQGGENMPIAPQQEEGQPAAVQPADSDQDGLTDEEEKQLGIDSSKVDTDDDGLFDREEVKVYETDPLNPDTDGDGYLDGDEVKNSYNPKGAGKLYQVGM